MSYKWIRVSLKTYQALLEMKNSINARSFDEVVSMIIEDMVARNSDDPNKEINQKLDRMMKILQEIKYALYPSQQKNKENGEKGVVNVMTIIKKSYSGCAQCGSTDFELLQLLYSKNWVHRAKIQCKFCGKKMVVPLKSILRIEEIPEDYKGFLTEYKRE